MQDNSITTNHEEGVEKMQIQKEKMFFRPLGSHILYMNQIKPVLQKMAEGIHNSEDLVIKLRQFKIFNEPRRLNIQRKLSNKIQEFMYTELKRLISSKNIQYQVLPLFSYMAKFILSQEKHFQTRKIQILQQSTNDSIHLTKQEVLYTLCLMAFNLVPFQDYDEDSQNPKRRNHFPKWNDFSHIFSTSEYKTNTIMAYFNHNFGHKSNLNINETFTIQRNSIKLSAEMLIKNYDDKKMNQPEIKSNHTSIEQLTGLAKVDFANKYIGGGALHDGCVQEEIMFSNHPELFISGIFCQMMLQNQSIFLQGFRKYSKNEGYGFKVSYSGQQQITQQTFKTQQYIIAIDAIRFQYKLKLSQYKKPNIDRQLIKAFAGFSNLPPNIHVATGNWGCGVFNGDVKLKFLIQWLACSITQRKMVYCPFGFRETLLNNKKVIQKLKQKSIADFYRLLTTAGNQMKDPQWNIFQLINQQLEQQLKPKI